MNREQKEALFGNVSLTALILAIVLVFVSFFYPNKLWQFISGIAGLAAIMKISDALRYFLCDEDGTKGRSCIISGAAFIVLAVGLLFV